MTQFQIILCFIQFAFFIVAGGYMHEHAKKGEKTGLVTMIAGMIGIVLMVFYLIIYWN